MYFPSKKDWLFRILAWGPVTYIIVLGIFDLIFSLLNNSFEFDLFTTVGLVFVIFLITYTWFNTGYTVQGSVLKIQYGLFKGKLNIQKIKVISAGNRFVSAPALSMDKIDLHYGKLGLMINVSPENKTEFVRQLLKQNPTIKVEIQLDDL